MYYVIEDECIGCEACIDACPADAIEIGDYSFVTFSTNRCIECGACADICPISCIGNNGGSMYDIGNDFDMNLFQDSADFWYGWPYAEGRTPDGMDCSHFVNQVYDENGLPYDYCTSSGFATNPHFVEVETPQDGDLMVWYGEHVGIYISNPPIPGYYIFGETSSAGVRYGDPNWWTIGRGLGAPKYYRYKP